jgi:hypothetical protein
MLTTIHIKQLAIIYDMAESTMHEYLQPHKEKLKELATKYFNAKRKREVVRKQLNSDQLQYIITNVFKGHEPIGYKFDGNTLVKTTDYV